MHPKVLSAEAWKLIRLLSGSALLDGWTLCEGTGLALQLGHRYSEDLDILRVEDLEIETLSGRLAEHGDLVVHDRAPGTRPSPTAPVRSGNNTLRDDHGRPEPQRIGESRAPNALRPKATRSRPARLGSCRLRRQGRRRVLGVP